jgi:hypothetical protein
LCGLVRTVAPFGTLTLFLSGFRLKSICNWQFVIEKNDATVFQFRITNCQSQMASRVGNLIIT